MRVHVLTDRCGVTFGISFDDNESHGQQNQDQSCIEADVDVECVEVSRRPLGLEQLRPNRISSRPSDD